MQKKVLDKQAKNKADKQLAPSHLNELLSAATLIVDDTAWNYSNNSLTLKQWQLLLPSLLDINSQIIDRYLIDSMLIELDQKLSRQMDAILHAPLFRQLEASWRSLKFLVERIDFKENIVVNMLNITKDELLEDLTFSSEIIESGFYKHIYSSGYGQFGGHPIAAIIADYSFNASASDIKLLQYVSSIGAMAHTPFISAIAPEFLGLNCFTELSAVKDLQGMFASPFYNKWRNLRNHADARYLGLTLPRFILRTPYSMLEKPILSFHYNESVRTDHEHYLWGNAAYLFATCLASSFAKYRWCPNIIGQTGGGAVKNLLVHHYASLGHRRNKMASEVLITDQREFELAAAGLIPFTLRNDGKDAVFFSANSVQQVELYTDTEQGRSASTNDKLGTQLPYMFIINRIAHYIKVLQREQIGAWKERADIERELNIWLKKYVAAQENPPIEIRCRRPLRAARIQVTEIEGEPGWYMASLTVRPHFKYMGAGFDLSLKGRLDKNIN